MLEKQRKGDLFDLSSYLTITPEQYHAGVYEAWEVLARYMNHQKGITYAMQGYALDETGTIRPDVLNDHVFITSTIDAVKREMSR